MDYSPIADYYHLIEKVTMGHVLQDVRTCQLDHLGTLAFVQNALLVGEGDGSFLIAFARQFPHAQITVIEPSGAMVQRAKKRLLKAGLSADRVSFIHSGLLECELPAAEFDFVTTLFFFDNFDDPTVHQCINHILPALTGSAYWLVSDFCVPESGWLRWRAQLWLKVLYAFFSSTAAITAGHLPEIETCLKAPPLQLIERKKLCGQMLFSALYQHKP